MCVCVCSACVADKWAFVVPHKFQKSKEEIRISSESNIFMVFFSHLVFIRFLGSGENAFLFFFHFELSFRKLWLEMEEKKQTQMRCASNGGQTDCIHHIVENIHSSHTKTKTKQKNGLTWPTECWFRKLHCWLHVHISIKFEMPFKRKRFKATYTHVHQRPMPKIVPFLVLGRFLFCLCTESDNLFYRWRWIDRSTRISISRVKAHVRGFWFKDDKTPNRIEKNFHFWNFQRQNTHTHIHSSRARRTRKSQRVLCIIYENECIIN